MGLLPDLTPRTEYRTFSYITSCIHFLIRGSSRATPQLFLDGEPLDVEVIAFYAEISMQGGLSMAPGRFPIGFGNI